MECLFIRYILTFPDWMRIGGVKQVKLKGYTAGRANFLACLKAYLEYGINLRKVAFDFM